MSSFDPETQAALDALSTQTPAQPPATLGQVWDANWQTAGLSTLSGQQTVRMQALQGLRDAYQGATGVSAAEDARRQGIPLEGADPSEEVGTIRYLAQSLPDATRKTLDPYFDIDGQAGKIARAQERAAGETASNSWGLTAHGTAFLAGMARTMVDPANLTAIAATSPILAAAGVAPATIAGHAAVDFATNAGITVVQHPFVSMGREQLGLESPSLLEDATQAGLGGVALGGLFRAGGWALKRAFGGPVAPDFAARSGEPAAALDRSGIDAPPEGWRAAATQPAPDAQAALGHLEPDDFNAAARFVENRELVESSARGFGIEPWALARNMDAAARQLEEGGLSGGLAAWHASPHAFTDFSLSAVGSGEGAQAYGWGGYFAENVRVGLHYLRQFGGRDAHLYRVNLDTAPERLVDWDRPIAEQPAPVRDAFAAMTGLHPDDPGVAAQYPTAGDWIKDGGGGQNARDFATALRARGVDGIQYLDAMSRTGEAGTRNFVMFDDNKVRVLNRNGQPIHPVEGETRGSFGSEGTQEIAPGKARPGAVDGEVANRTATSPKPPEAAAIAPPPGLDEAGQALRAQAESALAAHGDDLRLLATDDKGVTAETTGRSLLSAADEFSSAVRELKDCIFGAAETLAGGAAS